MNVLAHAQSRRGVAATAQDGELTPERLAPSSLLLGEANDAVRMALLDEEAETADSKEGSRHCRL